MAIIQDTVKCNYCHNIRGSGFLFLINTCSDFNVLYINKYNRKALMICTRRVKDVNIFAVFETLFFISSDKSLSLKSTFKEGININKFATCCWSETT